MSGHGGAGRPGASLSRRIEADDGKVGGGVIADEVRGAVAAVGERDFDSRGFVNYVAVGEDEAVGGKDESGAAALPFAGLAGAALACLDDIDFDHRRAKLFGGANHRIE